MSNILLPAPGLTDANMLDVVARAARGEGIDRTLWRTAGLCAVLVYDAHKRQRYKTVELIVEKCDGQLRRWSLFAWE